MARAILERIPGDLRASPDYAAFPPAHSAAVASFRIFPGGFNDPEYVELERDYKWRAHERWAAELGPQAFRSLLRAGSYTRVANLAVGIESRTNLLFSFEKMALRDPVRSDDGARLFATRL